MTTQPQNRAVRNRFERRVVAAVRAQRLFERGEHILMAISGGPDSVALLAALVALAPAWRLKLSALHVNYGLRGEESDGDEQCVVRLCAEWNVPLIRERVQLAPAAGPRAGSSLQARAREARYEALRRAADALEADKIATGHTADDQAETLVMRMLRGSGRTGLAGIRPIRNGRYIRPLLGMRRADVLAYLADKSQTFRTDSSNAKPLYLRNRIRHELLPVLARFNPAIIETLAREADILREEDACLQQMAAEWMAKHVRSGALALRVSRKEFLQLPLALQRRVMQGLVRRASGSARNPAFDAVDMALGKIVKGRSGASLTVGEVRVVREYETIRLVRVVSIPACTEKAAGVVAMALAIPSDNAWPATGQMIRVTLSDTSSASVQPGLSLARFDADRFTHRLVLRSWKPGDWFCPRGMGGRRKKLSDYFSDIKLPREQRSRVPVLVAPDGILWVVGHRADHRFGVTAVTQRVLTVEVGPGESDGEDGY